MTRIADPLPSFCCVCWAGTNVSLRYIDFEVAHDGAPVLDRETGMIAVMPHNGARGNNDDLYVCEPCIRAAAELLALKPQLHSRQLREIRRLEIEREYWKARAGEMIAQLEKFKDAPEGVLSSEGSRRSPGRPRKVTV